jgi:15-cis-phytoene synthase
MADACQELVQHWDKDRYLSALFAPDEKRQHLFALYAFDVEISKIHTQVSEPQIGEIRLQWWLDTLEAIEKNHTIDHPIALSFASTVRQFRLPTEHLENLIEARRSELYADRFPNLFSLESYIAETDSTVMQCAAIILNREVAAQSSNLTGVASAAFGLARLMQRPSLLEKFTPQDATTDSLKQLALKRLSEARAFEMPPELLPALLPASLTELYIRGSTSALRKQWRIWRASRSGRI